jgi:hypothetical protein
MALPVSSLKVASIRTVITLFIPWIDLRLGRVGSMGAVGFETQALVLGCHSLPTRRTG